MMATQRMTRIILTRLNPLLTRLSQILRMIATYQSKIIIKIMNLKINLLSKRLKKSKVRFGPDGYPLNQTRVPLKFVHQQGRLSLSKVTKLIEYKVK